MIVTPAPILTILEVVSKAFPHLPENNINPDNIIIPIKLLIFILKINNSFFIKKI